MRKKLMIWAISILAAEASCRASTYCVYPDGSGDFPTIEAAVEAADHGDLILLGNGVFAGPGNREIDFSAKLITLRSMSGDPETCVIDGEDAYQAFFFHRGEMPATRLADVTIRNCRGSAGGAVQITDHAAPTISNCRFIGNTAGEMGGAIFCIQGYSLLESCEFRGNSSVNGGAATIGWGSNIELRDCTFESNQAYNGAAVHVAHEGTIVHLTGCTLKGNASGWSSGASGVYIAQGGHAEVERTIIAFGLSGPAVSFFYGGSASLACSDLYGNAGGDWVGIIAPQLGVNGNFWADPLFCNEANPDSALMLWDSSPCAPAQSPECGLVGAWPVGCSMQHAPLGVSTSILELHIVPTVALSAERAPVVSAEVSETCGPQVIEMCIISAEGRRVYAESGTLQTPGTWHARWRGTDTQHGRLAAGIYFCRVRCGESVRVRPMVLVE